MLRQNFFQSIKKKLDKFDAQTMRKLIADTIDELEMLNTVFNSMSEGVLVIDNQKKISYFNKMAVKNLSISALNILNEDFENVIDNPRIIEIINQTLKNEEKLSSYEIKITDTNYVSLSIYPLVKHSKIIGTIIITDDITLDKENERKLQRAENLSAVSTISAGIAHEIKNPLSAISIHVQLLQDTIKHCQCDVSEDMKYSINIVNDEIARLSDIVNNFLFAVRPIAPTLIPIPFNDFLDKFCQFIAPEFRDKNIVLVKSYGELPELLIDEKLFKQAVLNLTENAVAAVKGVNEPTIEFEASVNGDYVYFNVIDNGVGIPEQLQNKIFNPYFTTKSNGTGLGLTILYKIVNQHHGEISFTSKPGRTVFTVRLPMIYMEESRLLQ